MILVSSSRASSCQRWPSRSTTQPLTKNQDSLDQPKQPREVESREATLAAQCCQRLVPLVQLHADAVFPKQESQTPFRCRGDLCMPIQCVFVSTFDIAQNHNTTAFPKALGPSRSLNMDLTEQTSSHKALLLQSSGLETSLAWLQVSSSPMLVAKPTQYIVSGSKASGIVGTWTIMLLRVGRLWVLMVTAWPSLAFRPLWH